MVTYSGRREGLQAQGTRGMVQRGAVLVLILRTKKASKVGCQMALPCCLQWVDKWLLLSV